MFTRLALIAFVLVLGACSKEGGRTDDKARKAEATETQHAPAGVKPGSHQDWCDEHQVAESQCTRCNPALVPAFKATNDWCEEHGLPESQCTKCNPDLVITRPPEGT